MCGMYSYIIIYIYIQLQENGYTHRIWPGCQWTSHFKQGKQTNVRNKPVQEDWILTVEWYSSFEMFWAQLFASQLSEVVFMLLALSFHQSQCCAFYRGCRSRGRRQHTTLPSGWQLIRGVSLSDEHLQLQAWLGRAKLRHHQLRQHRLCHAYSVPVHHHGGVDHCPVLCTYLVNY